MQFFGMEAEEIPEAMEFLCGEYDREIESVMITSRLSKPERIAQIIQNTYGEITKSEIMKKCSDISQITVQRTLADLLESEDITKISGGRYTKYIWNREQEQ